MTQARLLAVKSRPATEAFPATWDIRYIDEGEVIDASASDPEVGRMLEGLEEFALVRLGLTLRKARRRIEGASIDIYGAYRPLVVLAEPAK